LLVSVSPSERQAILEYWSRRFGVPDTLLEGLRFLARGKTVWAMADLAGIQETLASLKVEAAGFPILRRRGEQWKPTTAALFFLGDAIAKNVVELTAERLDPFLRGEVLSGSFPVDGGYVAVRFAGKMLGCALHGKGGLRSQLPRAWVDALMGGRTERGEEEG
jgi:NOL1/NOP2/fmu family ribosome biogenesis protein